MMLKAVLLTALVAGLANMLTARVVDLKNGDQEPPINITLRGHNFTFNHHVNLTINNLTLTNMNRPALNCTPATIVMDDKWFNMTWNMSYPTSGLVLDITNHSKVGEGQRIFLNLNASKTQYDLKFSFSLGDEENGEAPTVITNFTAGNVSLEMPTKSDFLENKPRALKAFQTQLNAHFKEAIRTLLETYEGKDPSNVRNLKAAKANLRQLPQSQCHSLKKWTLLKY